MTPFVGASASTWPLEIVERKGIGHSETGADIKVIGERHRDDIAIAIACVFVSLHVANLADYLENKSRVRAVALQAARRSRG